MGRRLSTKRGMPAPLGRLFRSPFVISQTFEYYANALVISDTARSEASSSRAGSLPRRTSARLSQPSSTPTDKTKAIDQIPDTDDTSDGLSSPVSNDHHLPAVEVAIPANNASRSSHGSSAASIAEDTSGDGTNDGSTPGTSVAATPAASGVSTTRKRVSATARAQELRSLINRQRGMKRSSGGISAEAPTTETSDANMARDLQLREYQKPSKRQRVSANAARSALEIPNSTEDEEFVSELEGWGDSEEESLQEMYDSEVASLAGDDKLGQDGVDRDDAEHSDSASSTPPTDDQPVYPSRRQRNRNLGNRRGGGRGSRARTRTQGLSTQSCPPWMTYRVSERAALAASLVSS